MASAPAAAKPPAAAASAVAVTHLGSEHPNAASMLDSALAAHAREARAISAGAAARARAPVRRAPRRAPAAAPRGGSEHPNAAGMLASAIADHYSAPAAASGPQAAAGDGAVDPAYARAGSEHPVAAGMVDAALRGHRDEAPHNVFGMEH